jgi:hypothetical protein
MSSPVIVRLPVIIESPYAGDVVRPDWLRSHQENESASMSVKHWMVKP